jgi:hypothetical protein
MSAILDPKVIQKYNLGPVKVWVQKAAYFLGPRHGVTIIYGWRATDEFPDHPTGHAIDLMIKTISQGDAIAQDAINNHAALGITGTSYLIFNRRVWNDHQGWHPYTSTSNPHTDHVHITMWNAGTGVPGGTIPDDQTTNIDGTAVSTTSTTTYTCAWNIGSTCVLSKTAARDVVAALVMGTGLVLGVAGLILLATYALNMSDGSMRDTAELVGLR